MDEALLLRFKSDDTINAKGFSAAYVLIDEAENFDYQVVGGGGANLFKQQQKKVPSKQWCVKTNEEMNSYQKKTIREIYR